MDDDSIYRVDITTVRPSWWAFWRKKRRDWTVTRDDQPMDDVYAVDITRYLHQADELRINDRVVRRGLVYFDGRLTAMISFNEWLNSEVYRPYGDHELGYKVNGPRGGYGLKYYNWSQHQGDIQPGLRKYPW